MAKKQSTIKTAAPEPTKAPQHYDVLLDGTAIELVNRWPKEKADALCADLKKHGIGAESFPCSSSAPQSADIKNSQGEQSASRTETAITLLGDRLGQSAETLQAISDLLYHYQDKFQSDPVIVGAQNIIQAISEDWAETASRLWKGGSR